MVDIEIWNRSDNIFDFFQYRDFILFQMLKASIIAEWRSYALSIDSTIFLSRKKIFWDIKMWMNEYLTIVTFIFIYCWFPLTLHFFLVSEMRQMQCQIHIFSIMVNILWVFFLQKFTQHIQNMLKDYVEKLMKPLDFYCGKKWEMKNLTNINVVATN